MSNVKLYEVVNDWRLDCDQEKAIKDFDFLYHYYNQEDYSGAALTIFSNDGKLYEVYNTHCSCNGLEWDPEPTTIEELEKRKPYDWPPEEMELIKQLIIKLKQEKKNEQN